MTSSHRLVETTVSDKGIATLALNRPEKRNAMSKELLAELLPDLQRVSEDAAVKAIVLTGRGSFFCAGADLKDIAELDAVRARQCRYLGNLTSAMSNVRKPLIAAVNGPALGGGFELALMCDLIVASRSAYFALPEVKRGLIPGAGGTQRLTAALGKFMAMRTILYGKPITSQEALTSGLACEMFEDEDFLAQAHTVAEQVAENAPIAMSLAKEAICRADSLCRDDDFEKSLYWSTFGTQEKVEGIDQFLAKKNTHKGGS